MIPKTIRRRKKNRRMALSDIRRLVRYIADKATVMAMSGLFGDIDAAAVQMWAVAQMNRKVMAPLYHFCLSWAALEKPTDKQIMDAARLAVKALGATGHQAVVGVHRDRKGVHVHVAVVRVHPVTGKAFPTGHDYAKLEKVCRQVELAQGWAADRGRFDVEVDQGPDGPQVRLVPPSRATREAKQLRRQAGRGAAASDLGRERRTGIPPLAEMLSGPWKKRIRGVLDGARTWARVHDGLAPLGLDYVKVGSGARITLRGCDASLKPSQFGAAYSLPALHKRLGPWHPPVASGHGPLRNTDRLHRPPPPGGDPALHRAPSLVAFATIVNEPGARLSLRWNETFTRSLLERTYSRITLDDDLVRAMHRVALDGVPPRVVLRTGAEVRDEGNHIGTTVSNDYATQAHLMVSMALAKGWTACTVSGSAAFKRSFARAAARTGLEIKGLPPDIAAEIAAETVAHAGAEPRLVAAASAPRPTASEEPAPVPIAPEGPRQAHAERDLKRARNRELRDKARSEAAALETRQASERTTLDALVGKRRGPVPTILRRGLAKHQDAARKSVRSERLRTHPLPIVPLDAGARRERTGRKAQAGEIDHKAAPLPDHTTCRQHWHLGHRARASKITAHIDEKILARHPSEVRCGPFGGLLMAHRDAAGSIVGFEQDILLPDGTLLDSIAAGGRRTAFMLGNPDTAKRVIVVANGRTALALASAEDGEDTLYVSVAGRIGNGTKARLGPLLKDREVVAVFASDDGGDALMTQLAAFCPWAERALAPEPKAPPVLHQIDPTPAKRSRHLPISSSDQDAGSGAPVEIKAVNQPDDAPADVEDDGPSP
jgi:hypothetical protein